MPDNAFAHDRLASLYDLAEEDRADLVHYERIVAEFGAGAVLDIGCGTGTLACRLANAGIDVVGVDPAQASLDLARGKEYADRVRWILGDAVSTADAVGEASQDMALMTGNVAQVFLGDDWHDTLAATNRTLRPGGRFVFETRDPSYRGWEEWTKEQSHKIIESPTEGAVETWVELTEVALPLVSFRWTFRFESDGAELHSDSTLRFRDRDEIDDSLRAAGFEIDEIRDAPDRPGKEFVYVASKPKAIESADSSIVSSPEGPPMSV